MLLQLLHMHRRRAAASSENDGTWIAPDNGGSGGKDSTETPTQVC
jgi:hypothetical protein